MFCKAVDPFAATAIMLCQRTLWNDTARNPAQSNSSHNISTQPANCLNFIIMIIIISIHGWTRFIIQLYVLCRFHEFFLSSQQLRFQCVNLFDCSLGIVRSSYKFTKHLFEEGCFRDVVLRLFVAEVTDLYLPARMLLNQG